MKKKTFLTFGLTFGVALTFMLAGGAVLAAEGGHIEKQQWAHRGFTGQFDKAQLRRGFQIYREVCSGCHSLKYIAFRNLLDIGYSEAEAKAIAADYEVEDGPNDEGEMFTRPARLSDYIPGPFANDQAARASNNGALPPDLSLIIKARSSFHGLKAWLLSLLDPDRMGEDYVFALLTSYEDEPPEDVKLGDGMNYNPIFPGSQIAMAPPLYDEAVEYADGTKATLDQEARDVVSFLTWTAEPKLDARKRLGFKTMIYLIILTGLLYAAYRRVRRKVMGH
jgi:ubiquinol-cytochrome c reductase cytochrome c1 subunit